VVQDDSFDQFDLSTSGIQAASVLLAKGDYKEILPPALPGFTWRLAKRPRGGVWAGNRPASI
jgi:hypothetical protein